MKQSLTCLFNTEVIDNAIQDYPFFAARIPSKWNILKNGQKFTLLKSSNQNIIKTEKNIGEEKDAVNKKTTMLW